MINYLFFYGALLKQTFKIDKFLYLYHVLTQLTSTLEMHLILNFLPDIAVIRVEYFELCNV
jgi:hypothetical protein